MNIKCYQKISYSPEYNFIRVISDLNIIKKSLLIFLLFSITYSSTSQNISTDSTKSTLAAVNQQVEPLNIYYEAVNNKFVIENNTKQTHNLNFGIYNVTGTPVKQCQFEVLNNRSSEFPIELNAGIYIVNVVDKSFSYTKKFIIR